MQKRVLQVEDLVLILDIVRPKGFYFAGESHDFWEGVFVYKGKVTATADERVYQLDQGKLLLHKPMEFHRIWEAGESAPRFVNISFRLSGVAAKLLENTCFELDNLQQEHLWEVIHAFQRVEELGWFTRGQSPQEVSQSMEIQEASQSMKTQKVSQEAEAQGVSTQTDAAEWKRQLAVSKAEVLLEAFLLELIEAGEQSAHVLSSDEVRYARIVNVMKENSHRMLSVAELAELCELSVSNMKRIFACFSDVGVAKFFMSLKMRRAKELLDDGKAVKEVAALLDFDELSYFYTVFKRETGMTPTQYRKRRGF